MDDCEVQQNKSMFTEHKIKIEHNNDDIFCKGVELHFSIYNIMKPQ